jgi:hypothetical protein
MFTISRAMSYRPGASVVRADAPGGPIMTVLRGGIWGHRAWYVVAWIEDHSDRRHETFVAEDDLRPVSAVLAT